MKYVCSVEASRWIMPSTGIAKFLEKVLPGKAKCCVEAHAKSSAVGRRQVPAGTWRNPQEKTKEGTQLTCFPYLGGLIWVFLSFRLIQGTSGRKAPAKWIPCQAKGCFGFSCTASVFVSLLSCIQNTGPQFLNWKHLLSHCLRLLKTCGESCSRGLVGNAEF